MRCATWHASDELRLRRGRPTGAAGIGGRQRRTLSERSRGGNASASTLPNIRSADAARSGALGAQFEALTQLARAHAALKPTQRKLVDAFVDHAISTTAARSVARFHAVRAARPQRFQAVRARSPQSRARAQQSRRRRCPGSCLHDHYDKGAAPLSVNSGMIRQLLAEQRTRAGRCGRRHRRRSSSAIRSSPIRSSQTSPGAAEEADAVAAQLASRGYTVMSLDRRGRHTPTAVLSALHERPWRILHLAAHGVFEFIAGARRPHRSAGSCSTAASSSRPRKRESDASTSPISSSSTAAILARRAATTRGPRRFIAWRPTWRRSSSRWACGPSSRPAGPSTTPRLRLSPAPSTT